MIIGLSGRAGVGKDTVGNFLVKNHSFEKVSLADPMKDFVRKMFGWNDEHLHGALKETVDPRYNCSPRHALQTLGTQWGRVCYENVWVDYAMKEARKRLAYFKSDGVVICDVRFRNELDAIQAAGGKVWRIVREDARRLIGASAGHASETELVDAPEGYDRVLTTTGFSLTDTETLVARVLGGRA